MVTTESIPFDNYGIREMVCIIQEINRKLRNPFFLDRVSGFDWTVIPVLSGQRFFYFLPAVVVV